MQFPSVQGENLAGQSLVFPRDFGDRQTLAIVAFDLKARAALTSWIPFAGRCVGGGTVGGLIFAVMPRSMQMAKGIILTAMRKAVPTEARSATVALFVDIDEFCATLDITDRNILYVYVIASDGTLRERQTGAYTDLAASAIEMHFETPA